MYKYECKYSKLVKYNRTSKSKLVPSCVSPALYVVALSIYNTLSLPCSLSLDLSWKKKKPKYFVFSTIRPTSLRFKVKAKYYQNLIWWLKNSEHFSSLSTRILGALWTNRILSWKNVNKDVQILSCSNQQEVQAIAIFFKIMFCVLVLFFNVPLPCWWFHWTRHGKTWTKMFWFFHDQANKFNIRLMNPNILSVWIDAIMSCLLIR